MGDFLRNSFAYRAYEVLILLLRLINAIILSCSLYLPNTLPETGLIHLTDTQIKFGIWMMPDNKMRGMLETFLAYMIPDENQ